MSFNVDNFIAAPNESLLIDSKVDENGNFQNLYLKWGDANVAIFKKGNDTGVIRSEGKINRVLILRL